MNFEQADNIENIIKLLSNDDVSRNKYLFNFLKIINNNGNNRIISLNGNWGSGKTIFVKKLVTLIKYCYMYKDKESCWENIYNELELFSEENIQGLDSIIKKDEYIEFDRIVKEQLINCVYFNAWEHDDEDDPMISIIYELIKEFNLSDETQSEKLGSVVDNINIIIRNIPPKKIDLSGLIKKEDLAENIRRKDDIKKSVNRTIDNLINEKCNKLVIFIDELDRCNPIYAVRLLERIKHYFTDERIVIVVSTNLVELSNTISGMYGNKFSSTSYLDKFFDIRLELPKLDINKYISTLKTVVNEDRSAWFSIAVDSFIKFKHLNPREVNRYLGCIRFFEKNILKTKFHPFDGYQNLIDYLFVPFIVGLYTIDPIEYNDFKNLSGWENLKKYILSEEELLLLCKSTLYEKNNNTVMDIKDEECLVEVEKLYHLMFDSNYKDKFRKKGLTVGNQELRYNSFDYLEDKISLLGALSDFGEV